MEKPENSSDKPEKKGISPVKTLAAIIFGVVYIVVLLLIGKFPIVLPIALSFLIILAEREYTALVANKGIKTERISLLFFSLLFVWSEYCFWLSMNRNEGDAYYVPLSFLGSLNFAGTTILFSLLTIPLVIYLQTKAVPDFVAVSVTFFGIIYIGCLFSFFVKLMLFSDLSIPSDVHPIPYVSWLWLMTILTWGADVGGYIFGKLLKGPKLIPSVSPGKTWSGVFGGIILCMVTFLIFSKLKIWGNSHFAAIFHNNFFLVLSPIIIYFSALAGDLFESAMKRYFGVKDTAGLIPEHGGILDRFDSMLFVAPTIYFLFFLMEGFK